MLGIFVLQNLNQIVVIQLAIVAQVLKNVFNCDISIVVLVKQQKRFPYRLEAVGEFNLKFIFQLKQSTFNDLWLLLAILIELVSNVLGLNILDVVFVLLHEIQVWEEKLLETVKVDPLRRFTEEIVLAKKVVHFFLREVDFAAHEV